MTSNEELLMVVRGPVLYDTDEKATATDCLATTDLRDCLLYRRQGAIKKYTCTHARTHVRSDGLLIRKRTFGIVARLQTERSVVRIPAWARDFSLLQNVQTGSRTLTQPPVQHGLFPRSLRSGASF